MEEKYYRQFPRSEGSIYSGATGRSQTAEAVGAQSYGVRYIQNRNLSLGDQSPIRLLAGVFSRVRVEFS